MKDLPKEDQELIEEILRKDANSLSKLDKIILSARRDYIDETVYKKMMGEDKPKREVKEDNHKEDKPKEVKKEKKL